jgi:release factor glutamine methyltransferase
MSTDHGQRTTDQSWTFGKLLDWTAKFLAEKRAEFPRLDAEVLLAHVEGCKRIELYTRYEEPASESVRARFKELVRKRIEGCPVAYLVGRKEFFSLEFDVGPAVLIPRPDTETLVTECLERVKELTEPAIADVGTGSGAIAIALAKHHPQARITAIDLSAEALAIARRNADKHGVQDRIQFLEGDLLAPLPAGASFDIIASNPPYIAREDWDKLPVGVRQYEPRMALEGGPSGYQVVEKLIEWAKPFLRLGGYLIVEIGSPQESRVRQMIESHSGYELGPTIRDYSGHPRVLRARWVGR